MLFHGFHSYCIAVVVYSIHPGATAEGLDCWFGGFSLKESNQSVKAIDG